MKATVWVRVSILLLLLALAVSMSVSWRGKFSDNGSVTLYLPDGSYSYTTLYASEARTAEPVEFALWRQQEGMEVTNTEFKRSKRIALMTVFGDSTIPLPSLSMLLPNSGLACLLDRNSCYELFGDTDAIGGKLMLEDRLYTVVAVFDWPTGILVRQGRAGQDAACNRITLAPTGVASRAQSADEFAMRHGLSPYAVARLGFKTEVASFIPSRWSDFEFWELAAGQLKEQLWMMLVLPKELPQAIPMRVTLHLVIWCAVGLLSAILLVHTANKHIRGKRPTI